MASRKPTTDPSVASLEPVRKRARLSDLDQEKENRAPSTLRRDTEASDAVSISNSVTTRTDQKSYPYASAGARTVRPSSDGVGAKNSGSGPLRDFGGRLYNSEAAEQPVYSHEKVSEKSKHFFGYNLSAPSIGRSVTKPFKAPAFKTPSKAPVFLTSTGTYGPPADVPCGYGVGPQPQRVVGLQIPGQPAEPLVGRTRGARAASSGVVYHVNYNDDDDDDNDDDDNDDDDDGDGGVPVCPKKSRKRSPRKKSKPRADSASEDEYAATPDEEEGGVFVPMRQRQKARRGIKKMGREKSDRQVDEAPEESDVERKPAATFVQKKKTRVAHSFSDDDSEELPARRKGRVAEVQPEPELNESVCSDERSLDDDDEIGDLDVDPVLAAELTAELLELGDVDETHTPGEQRSAVLGKDILDPSWYKVLDWGKENPVSHATPDQDVVALQHFEEDVLYSIRVRRDLALSSEPNHAEFPLSGDIRRLYQSNSVDQLYQIVLTGINETRRKVLGRRRFNRDVIDDLPRMTREELGGWLVYLDDLLHPELGEFMYDGSGTSLQPSGAARLAFYENIARRASAGEHLPRSITKSYHNRLLCAERTRASFRLVAVFDKIKTPRSHVIFVEGLICDLYQCLEKGYVHQPLQGRSYHTFRMEQASIEACPPSRRNPPYKGANHAHQYRQGVLGDSVKRKTIQTSYLLTCSVCDTVMDSYQPLEWAPSNLIPGCQAEWICTTCQRAWKAGQPDRPGYQLTDFHDLREWRVMVLTMAVVDGISHTCAGVRIREKLFPHLKRAAVVAMGVKCPFPACGRSPAPNSSDLKRFVFFQKNQLFPDVSPHRYVCGSCHLTMKRALAKGKTIEDVTELISKPRMAHITTANKKAGLAANDFVCQACLEKQPDHTEWERAYFTTLRVDFVCRSCSMIWHFWEGRRTEAEILDYVRNRDKRSFHGVPKAQWALK